MESPVLKNTNYTELINSLRMHSFDFEEFYPKEMEIYLRYRDRERKQPIFCQSIIDEMASKGFRLENLNEKYNQIWTSIQGSISLNHEKFFPEKFTIDFFKTTLESKNLNRFSRNYTEIKDAIEWDYCEEKGRNRIKRNFDRQEILNRMSNNGRENLIRRVTEDRNYILEFEKEELRLTTDNQNASEKIDLPFSTLDDISFSRIIFASR